MEKIKVFSLIFFFFILFSCALDNTAPIRIALVTLPPEVVKLHVAVFSGDEVLTQTSVDVSDLAKDNMIELYVSAGKNRQVVMVAECYTDKDGTYAGYAGENKTDISAGKEVSVSLDMNPLTYVYYDGSAKYWGTYSYSRTPYPNYVVEWSSVEIPNSRYRIAKRTSTGDVFFYEGLGTSVMGASSQDATGFRITVIFDMFGLESLSSAF